jgi:hypothetical protein
VAGFYTYSIYVLSDQSNLIETGTMQVIAPAIDNTIIFNEATDDSGFIVFNL